jgi:hypothetical protein
VRTTQVYGEFRSNATAVQDVESIIGQSGAVMTADVCSSGMAQQF